MLAHRLQRWPSIKPALVQWDNLRMYASRQFKNNNLNHITHMGKINIAKQSSFPSNYPMLVQCWPTVCNQHWFNSSCLLELCSIARWSAYCWRRIQADTDSMSGKCWVSIAGAGQYPFSPSQYFMLAVPACWCYRHDALN